MNNLSLPIWARISCHLVAKQLSINGFWSSLHKCFFRKWFHFFLSPSLDPLSIPIPLDCRQTNHLTTPSPSPRVLIQDLASPKPVLTTLITRLLREKRASKWRRRRRNGVVPNVIGSMDLPRVSIDVYTQYTWVKYIIYWIVFLLKFKLQVLFPL